jgi:hypothetical protein
VPEIRDAPDWVAQGKLLAGAVSKALESGEATTRLQSRIERAWAAWQLGEYTDREISRVAHLVRRAHEAIREASKKSLESAYVDCAHVLHGGLPSQIRKRVALEDVLVLVRDLRDAVSAQAAVVEGTMRVLRWDELCRGIAAEAIRVAWEEDPPVSSRR